MVVRSRLRRVLNSHSNMRYNPTRYVKRRLNFIVQAYSQDHQGQPSWFMLIAAIGYSVRGWGYGSPLSTHYSWRGTRYAVRTCSSRPYGHRPNMLDWKILLIVVAILT